MDKQTARHIGLNARASVSAEKRAAYDAALLVRMKRLARHASMVGCYVSRSDEPDTHVFLEWCFQNRIPVAVPKVEGSTLGFYRIASMHDLKPGCFGVLEPEQGTRVAADEIDLVFVPLSSFDAQNNRTGYGKGYYDSILTRAMYKVGIAYPEQQVDQIDADPWDIRLNGMILPDET